LYIVAVLSLIQSGIWVQSKLAFSLPKSSNRAV